MFKLYGECITVGEAEAVIERCTASGQLNYLRVISLGKILETISFTTLNPSIPPIRDQKGSRQNQRDPWESPGIPRYGLLTGCEGLPGPSGEAFTNKELPPKLGNKQPSKFRKNSAERWRASALYSTCATTIGRRMQLPRPSILSGTRHMTGK